MVLVSDPEAHGKWSTHRADPLSHPGRGGAGIEQVVAVERTHVAGDRELLRSYLRHQAVARAPQDDLASLEPALRNPLTRRELDPVRPASEPSAAGTRVEGAECFDQ